MFDPQEVINMVQNKRYPQGWRVLAGDAEGRIYLLKAFVTLFGGAMLLLLLGIITSSFQQPVAIVLSLLIGILAIFALLFWLLRSYLADRRSRFVFLPEGVVDCYRGKRDKVAFLHFEQIQKMSLDHQTSISTYRQGYASSSLDVWLDIYFLNGTFVKWDLPFRYGDPIALGGNIVASYEYFMRQHGQRQF
jgi:hypothetical protein